MLKLKAGNGPVMRAAEAGDTKAVISKEEKLVHLSGGTFSEETKDDTVFRVYEQSEYYRSGLVSVENAQHVGYEVLNPNVGSINADGTVERKGDGILKVLVHTPPVKRLVKFDFRTQDDELFQPKEFVDTVDGSLVDHIRNIVDSRINDTMTMSQHGRFYTTQDHANKIYVRNPDLWCADIDRTCISPWNSNGGVRKAGVLITPRHVYNADHYKYPVGTIVRFVGMDGTVYDRTVIGRSVDDDQDIAIYTLDSDLPAAVTPCRMMPPETLPQDGPYEGTYMRNNLYSRPPALALDQEEKAIIVDYLIRGKFQFPEDPVRLIFSEEIVVGDSGNPAFLLVEQEGVITPILITIWTFGNAGIGFATAGNTDLINQKIVETDTQAGVSAVDDPTWPNANGHYQVKEADFSAFPNYA
jgi:hypothetical protein